MDSARLTLRPPRIARAVAAATLMLVVAAPAAFAGKPVTSPSVFPPTEFAAGEACVHAVVFEDMTINARDSAFDPAHDGSIRFLTRGSAVSKVTDVTTGDVYPMRGGYHFLTKVEADGSFRVDATGTDILAWYFEGDDSDLDAGLWDIEGHVTEWYGADGSFIRATFDGHAVDVCAALAG